MVAEVELIRPLSQSLLVGDDQITTWYAKLLVALPHDAIMNNMSVWFNIRDQHPQF
jgi:hypothetical protein